jgi:hypothetical protein
VFWEKALNENSMKDAALAVLVILLKNFAQFMANPLLF